jgi:hypothetical protein
LNKFARSTCHPSRNGPLFAAVESTKRVLHNIHFEVQQRYRFHACTNPLLDDAVSAQLNRLFLFVLYNFPGTCQTKPVATHPPTQAKVARLLHLIEQAKQELLSSVFFEGLRHQLRAAAFDNSARTDDGSLVESTRRLVVYGLGSLEQPGALHIRYQVALACLLSTLLPNLDERPQTFDPVFTPLDKAVLKACGFDVMTRNEQGRHVAHCRTLFFMPHCEAELTDSLLDANLNAQNKEAIHNVAVLGNTFSEYIERYNCLRSGQKSGVPRTMLTLHEKVHLSEAGVRESGFPVAGAFNDMSLHTFKSIRRN